MHGSVLIVVALLQPLEEPAKPPALECRVWDADPAHDWNRLHVALWDETTRACTRSTRSPDS